MTSKDDWNLPPETPEAFEALCLDLFRTLWDDSGANLHGRRGQKQDGVDVYGKENGRWIGVQCKQKDGLLRTRVTVKELDAEIQAAKRFEPSLHQFILATTGPASQDVQERARVLCDAEDPPFEVEVWDWKKIWSEVYRDKDLLQRFQEVHWPRIRDGQRIAPTRLTHTAPQLFGRDRRLAELDAAWNEPNKNVVSIIAWGGVGKTCLVASWVAKLAEDEFDGADYFDWSFYSQGTRELGSASADAFVKEALIFFGDRETAESTQSPWTKGSRLAELVGRRRTLLVLDGLEPLQYPPGPLDGELKDPAIQALLKGLAAKNAGLCVVTSRVGIKNLESFRATTAPEWNLEHLRVPAGVALLDSLGVHGSKAEMQAAIHDVEGHALTLNLLGRFLKRAHGGDVRRRDRVNFQKADAKTQGGHAFRAMDAYARWLAEGGEDGVRQLAVLQLLGLFDRPASADCLNALRQEPAIDGVTDALVDLDDEDWNLTVSDLEDAKLLVRGPDDSLDAHPLIREYFAARLRRDNPAGWKASHGRLFDHLQASTEHQPDTLEGLQPLYQAVVHGCLAGREQEACDRVYRDRILRGTGSDGFYSAHKLGAFGADLGAIACFFERPWNLLASTLSEADQAWLLNEAAFRLRALGRLRESVEPMRAALQPGVEREDWKSAAIRASNLSQLQLTLGDVEEALHNGEQAVDFADLSEDWGSQVIHRTTLADALHQAGRRSDALELFQEAEGMQAERQPQYPLLYSVQGFRYCDLLVADAERAAWRARRGAGAAGSTGASEDDAVAVCREVTSRATQTLEWMITKNMPILDIALDHLTLGRSRLYAAILDSHEPLDASTEIESAVDGLRRAGTIHHIPRGLLTRAWLRASTDDPDGARADLDEAWEIAERGPMPLFQADVLLLRARLFEDPEPLEEARRLIEKHGYGRRLGELEDAEAWLLRGEESSG